MRAVFGGGRPRDRQARVPVAGRADRRFLFADPEYPDSEPIRSGSAAEKPPTAHLKSP